MQGLSGWGSMRAAVAMVVAGIVSALGSAQVAAQTPGTAPSAMVPQAEADCISLVRQEQRRWGANDANRAVHYHYRNACDAAMVVEGTLSRNDGPDVKLSTVVCPRKTERLVCASVAGKGCVEISSYTVRQGSEGTCR